LVDTSKVEVLIEKVICDYSQLDDENTNSGYVITEEKPSYNIYDDCIKKVLEIDYIKNVLNDINAVYKGYKNMRGLIGSTSSIAWDDRSDHTFELIGYREGKMWGKKRIFKDESAKKVDKKYSSTFDNYDYKNNHNRLVPSSPCPVLFGIRGDDYNDLIDSKKLFISEKIDGWIIYKSNQGSDDHLQKTMINDIEPFMSVICRGKVVSEPKTIRGGHVFFRICDETGTIDCAAYEPTKEFRDIVRNLVQGDIVEVFGGIREKPMTVNIEKIRIISLENIVEKVENPVCPKCGKHMKSKGKNQGFKCIRCKTKSKKPIVSEKKRNIKPGFYEVPVCARRHLSKPLKRIR